MPDKFLLLLVAAFCFLVPSPGPAAAEDESPQDPTLQISALQDIYRDLTSLSFDFSQVTRTGGRARQGAGNAIFYRPAGKPGIMRWNYIEPDTQVILNDGSKLSIYNKADNQLIVTSAGEMQSDITYAFFAGTRNLLDDFTAGPAGDRFIFSTGDKNMRVVQLIPRTPHAQIKALDLWFDADFLIRKLIIEDHFDSITELIFTNIKLNELPADSADTLAELLRLDLPPDTEIISQ
jgi:outer membrane lipoprotein-sorting protein